MVTQAFTFAETALNKHVFTYASPPPAFEEGGGSYRGLIYVLIFVVVAAFGGLIWNMYGVGAPPRLTPPPGEWKIEATEQTAPAAEENALFDALDGTENTSTTTTAAATPAPEAVIAEPQLQTGAPRIGAAPVFASSGPFVAQIAALQSEQAVSAAWARLATRAPELFSPARMDVERADLGARGIYFRVRAGYFADRANATRFCDRIRQMGQDCIVVAR